MVSIAVLSLLIFVIWYFELVQRIFRFWKIVLFAKTIQGPTTKEFIQNSKSSRLLQFLCESGKKYGSLFGIWIGKDLVVFITNPEHAKVILSSQELIYKSKNHEILKPWLGEGLLISGGDKWQKARKFLTPAFHFNILRQFYGAMNECGQILIKKLEKVADGETEVDIYPFITLFALDVICETALGIKKNSQENSESEYVKAVQGICQLLHHRAFNFFLRNDFIYKFSSQSKKQEKLLKILHGETQKVIEERRKAIYSMDISTMEALNTAESDSVSKKRLAFLDMLLIGQKEGKDISDKQIQAEVDTFMFEGHDTTSSAISFAIYLLSTHPELQKRAYTEAVQMAGFEMEPMKYIESFIKETLRVFPSVPMYSRTLRQDFSIGGKMIPRGITISTLAYAIQRDPTQFPDPEVFNPDRYYENDTQHHPFSFVAFSAGPRNCIGQKFAMLELKTTLAKLLRTFEFISVDQKPILVPELILKSKTGIHVKIKKR